MKIVYVDHLPKELYEDWQQLMLGDTPEEAIFCTGVPVRRYKTPFGGSTWAPKWAHEFIEAWAAVTGWTWYSSDTTWTKLPETLTARAFIEMVQKLPKDKWRAFFDAGLAVLRLSGVSALSSFVVDAQVEYAVAKKRSRQGS